MLNSLPYEAPGRGKAWLKIVSAQKRKGRETLVTALWIVKDVMEVAVNGWEDGRIKLCRETPVTA